MKPTDELKEALAAAIRHTNAEKRRYRLNDGRDALVIQAAAAFHLMLQHEELAPVAAAFLEAVQPETPKP